METTKNQSKNWPIRFGKVEDNMAEIKRRMVYVAHSLAGSSGDIKENFAKNTSKIKRICQHMIDEIKKEEQIVKETKWIGDYMNYAPFPFAPQLYFPQFVDESKASSEGEFKSLRRIAIEFCMTILSKCDEVHVYNHKELSGGVRDDIEMASKLGIPVIFKEYPWGHEIG